VQLPAVIPGTSETSHAGAAANVAAGQQATHGGATGHASAPSRKVADDFWNEAKARRREEIPQPARHIDPTPLLVIAGGTVVLLLVIGGALLGVDNYLEDVRQRPSPSTAPADTSGKKNPKINLPTATDDFKQLDPRTTPLLQIARATKNWLDSSGDVYPPPGWSQRSAQNDPPKPLLSWRVGLAPYLGGADVYNEIRKDEPWDSDHNLTVVKGRAPAAFRMSPDDTTGMTQYLMVVGDDTPHSLSRIQIDMVQKWPSLPLMVVQVPPDKAVFWTKPDDWEYTFLSQTSDLGLPGDDQFLGMRYDGTVAWFSKKQSRDEIRKLFELPGKQR
jgi:hypothetical protein